MAMWLTFAVILGGAITALIRRRRAHASSVEDTRSPEEVARERRERLTLRSEIIERRLGDAAGRIRSLEEHAERPSKFGARLASALRRDAGAAADDAARALTEGTVLASRGDERAADLAFDRAADAIDRLYIMIGVRDRAIPMFSGSLGAYARMFQEEAVRYRDTLESRALSHGGLGIDVEDDLRRLRLLRNAFAANEYLFGPQPLKALAVVFRQIGYLNEIALGLSVRAHRTQVVVRLRSCDALGLLQRHRAKLDAEDAPQAFDRGDDGAPRIRWHVIADGLGDMQLRLRRAHAKVSRVTEIAASFDDPAPLLEEILDAETDLKRIEDDIVKASAAVREARRHARIANISS